MKRQFIGPGQRGDKLSSIQSGAAGICATVRTTLDYKTLNSVVFVLGYYWNEAVQGN